MAYKKKSWVSKAVKKHIKRPIVRKLKSAGLMKRQRRPKKTLIQKINAQNTAWAAKIRGQHSRQSDTVIEWNGEYVESAIRTAMLFKMERAVKSLRRQVVTNISSPVAYYFGPRGGARASRSKPGMYPFLESGELAENIFGMIIEPHFSVIDGYVASPTEYGAILETSRKLDRSFLRKTLVEHTPTLQRILTSSIEREFGRR